MQNRLHTRYTFEDDVIQVPSSASHTSSGSVYTAYDYSGRQLAVGENRVTYLAASRVPGREPASFAASFSADAPLRIPAPGLGSESSVCLWAKFTGSSMMGTPADELAYAWHLLCVVVSNP